MKGVDPRPCSQCACRSLIAAFGYGYEAGRGAFQYQLDYNAKMNEVAALGNPVTNQSQLARAFSGCWAIRGKLR